MQELFCLFFPFVVSSLNQLHFWSSFDETIIINWGLKIVLLVFFVSSSDGNSTYLVPYNSFKYLRFYLLLLLIDYTDPNSSI